MRCFGVLTLKQSAVKRVLRWLVKLSNGSSDLITKRTGSSSSASDVVCFISLRSLS
jgi:hypothetical protein